MTEDTHRILTTLNRPIRIVVFTPGELLMIIVPVIVGVILGGILGLVVGISGLLMRKHVIRFQRKYSPRWVQGLVYWQLPPQTPKKNVRLPLSYVREYVS